MRRTLVASTLSRGYNQPVTTIGKIGGEFALIERIAHGIAGDAEGALRVGIGDDAAVLTVGDTGLVVTTDLLIQDVHFRLSYGDPYSLGVKAAAVNLSDIAAMGATPTAAFISLALPAATEVEFLDELYRGMNETFGQWGAVIAGGDTNLSPGPLTINVTLLGSVPRGGATLRSTARPGDCVVVTGALGGAAAGFRLLESLGRAGAEELSADAVRAQLRPVPRISEARAAVATGGVSAMMDLSDGLMGDLAKLCRASGVGAAIERDRVPVDESARVASMRIDLDPVALALRGGEDYELLMTVRAADAARVCDAILAATGTPATVIGRITEESGVVLYDASGAVLAAPDGWDHFAA